MPCQENAVKNKYLTPHKFHIKPTPHDKKEALTNPTLRASVL
jgi:hypothetical protein